MKTTKNSKIKGRWVFAREATPPAGSHVSLLTHDGKRMDGMYDGVNFKSDHQSEPTRIIDNVQVWFRIPEPKHRK